MDKRLIAANALSFFSMVIVYQAFLTVASPLSAIRLPFSLMQLNLWFMFVSLFGVLLFAYTFHREPERDVTRLLHISLAVNGLSVLALAAGLAGKTVTFFLCIGGLLFPLACGYLDGCLFYLLARHTAPRRQGIAIGRTCDRRAAVFPLAFTASSPGTDCYPDPARSDRRNSATGGSPNAGLGPSASFLRHRDPAVPAHRPFVHAGIYKLRRILPQLARPFPPVSGRRVSGSRLAGGSLSGVAAGVGAAGQGHRFCFLHLCTGRRAPVVHRFWFFNVALRSRRPELWAGMGRAIERPFHVLGALAGEMLLEQKVSHGVMSLVYMGLLILAVVLLYRLFLLYAEAWKHSAVEESLAKVKAEAAKQTAAENYAKLLATENNENTAAANDLAAVPAENVADTNAAEETEIWEDFAFETAEIFTTETAEDSTIKTENDSPNIVTEQKTEAAEATPEIITKRDSSLPDDSGPLHGDRLRKYQLRYRLTNRETEVLWEILQKHKTADIATNLIITIPTAKYHISNILQKTGARNQRELRYLISKEEN